MPKLTQKQIAKALGIEQSRTSDVLKRLGLRGCNDLAEIQAKYMQHLRHQASQLGYGDPPTGGALSLAQERALLARQQREKLVLDMAIKAGDYMQTEVMAAEVAAMLGSFRGRMRQIPAEAAPAVATMSSEREVHDFLLDLVDRQLDECADWLTRLGEQADGPKRPATRRG